MYFSKVAVLFSLAVSAMAMPVFNDLEDRAPKSSKASANTTSTTTASSAGVLTSKAYADFQVSGGVAGNALAEVQAKFPVSRNRHQTFDI
jgi:hypothetical protein